MRRRLRAVRLAAPFAALALAASLFLATGVGFDRARRRLAHELADELATQEGAS